MTSLAISVVIPTRNRFAMLQQALHSVRTQEPGDYEMEIVVVDDGSTDATSTLESINGGQVLHVREGSCAGARNAGVLAATGDWIAFLDDDDAWCPNKLAEFAARIRQQPSLGFLSSQAAIVASVEPLAEHGAAGTWPAAADHVGLIQNVPAPSTWMIRRDVIIRLGLFDTSLRRAEERDLMYRMIRSGSVQVAAVEIPLTLYRQREEPDPELMVASWHDTSVALRRHRRGLASRVGTSSYLLAELRLRGWFAAAMLATPGHRRPGRRQIWEACRASPVHTLKALIQG